MVNASKLRESCFLRKYYLNISVSHFLCKILPIITVVLMTFTQVSRPLYRTSIEWCFIYALGGSLLVPLKEWAGLGFW